MDPARFRFSARFDGDRAMEDVHCLCAFGPRPAGSEASRRQARFVADRFRASGGSVRAQRFEAPHPLTGEPVAMANLIGSWWPERPARVVLGAHGDTRPMADLEPDPARRLGPFVGANDGASGVSVLLEIARHLPDLPSTSWGVDLVVFDAEELVFDEVGTYCLGSRFFARDALQAGLVDRFEAALVLDMVGGEQMALKPEGFSLDYASDLVDDIWSIAEQVEADAFRFEPGPHVEDDHLPLLSVGIPAVALVDMDDPRWHTLDDRPEHCSARSLSQTGRVVLAWLAGLD